MDWAQFLEKIFCFAVAAFGFAVLFNVPKRTLAVTSMLALLGGLTKVALLKWGVSLVLASLAGASLIGILAIQAAHSLHAPHLVFSIPAVIPLVPGIYTYRMMVGLVLLTKDPNSGAYIKTLAETVQNGLTAAFITMSIAIGIAIPMLVTRKKSGKFIKFSK